MKPFLFFLFLIVSGCGYSVPRGLQAYHEVGLASWYGEPFHGRKTSNGEKYDMYGLTAAHRTLPFGTVLQVTDLETGRWVEVRVNDRGPFIRGRILDLSYGAALLLGTVKRGVVEVSITVIRMGEDATSQRFFIQIGSFSDLHNADKVKQDIEKHREDVSVKSVETNRGLFHRVRVGPFQSSEEAYRVMHSLLETGLGNLNMVVLRAH